MRAGHQMHLVHPRVLDYTSLQSVVEGVAEVGGLVECCGHRTCWELRRIYRREFPLKYLI